MASQISRLSLVLLAFVAGSAACSTSTDPTHEATNPATSDSKDGGSSGATVSTTGGGNASGDASSGQSALTGPVVTGLPCDVQSVVATHCQSCHGSTTEVGAPFSLVTREDLLTPLPDQGGKTRLEVAIARVQNDAMPMPPAPNSRLDAAEISSLQMWFAAGSPVSTEACSAQATSGDAGSAYVDLPKPADCEETYEITAHGGTGADDKSKFTIDATPTLEGNEYYCFYFDPPYGSDQGMYWFESILDNLPVLHHWILWGTDNKTHTSGTSAGCNANEAGSYYLAGWAPGATNGAVTSDIALQLPQGPNAGLILEVHYYNNTGAAKDDASGIRFCTGKMTGRAHEAAVATLGSEGICVNPGETKEVIAQCDPKAGSGDIHITGVWPHMHKIGRNMKVAIHRADGTVDVIHDAPFDFNAQVFYPLNDVVMHEGDTIETTCTYTNDTMSQVHYGERTQDEMCYSFTPSWPAGALVSTPSPFGGTNTTTLNKCADPLSILQSCNGLADAPKSVTQPSGK